MKHCSKYLQFTPLFIYLQITRLKLTRSRVSPHMSSAVSYDTDSDDNDYELDARRFQPSSNLPSVRKDSSHNRAIMVGGFDDNATSNDDLSETTPQKSDQMRDARAKMTLDVTECLNSSMEDLLHSPGSIDNLAVVYINGGAVSDEDCNETLRNDSVTEIEKTGVKSESPVIHR